MELEKAGSQFLAAGRRAGLVSEGADSVLVERILYCTLCLSGGLIILERLS